MSDDKTNNDLYGVLLGIKEDIGGLKATTDLHLKALQNFGPRIGTLETDIANQKGAARVWSLMGAVAGACLGAAASYFGKSH